MMDKNRLEQALSELPLYIYSDIDPKSLEFAQRVRYICEHDCPMYGKSWACPPGWAAWKAANRSANDTPTAC